MCLGLVGVSLFLATFAQADPRFTGGVRVAFTAADLSAEQEYDPRFGVGGGIFLQGHAWKQLDLRVEANYAARGANLAVAESQIEWQMDYIDVPVLLVINLSPKSKTSVELCVGGSYGFPIHKQVEVGSDIGYHLEDYIGTDIFVNNTTEIEVQGVETSDISIALGMGLSVPVGAVNFLVDFRYTSGLTDPVVQGNYLVTTGEGDEAVVEPTPFDFSNRCFTFFIGFAFPFGSRTAPESE